MQRTGVRSWTLVVAGSLLIGSMLTGCGGGNSGPAAAVAQGNANGSTATAAINPGAAAATGTPTPGSTTTTTTTTTTDTGSTGSTSTQTGSQAATTGSTQTGVAQGVAGTVTLNWLPPTQNSDGSPLTGLAGYNIYYGTAPQSYSQSIKLTNPGLTTYVVENLPAGTYYFAIAAYDSTGAQSSFSPEVAASVTN